MGNISIADFVDSKARAETVVRTKGSPPPNYCVLRAGQTSPEILHAKDDDEMLDRVQREVRVGQADIVYIYKLVAAEKAVAHSKSLSVDDIRAMHSPELAPSFPKTTE